MSINSPILLSLLFLLLLILFGLLGYIAYQSKLNKHYQQRFEQYLSSNQAGLTGSDQQELFRAQYQLKGVKGYLRKLYLRIGDVANITLLVIWCCLVVTSVLIVIWLGSAWSLLAQVFTLFVVNMLALQWLYQWQVKRLAEEFEHDFPHAVATVSRAISAGLSLNAALIEAKQQTHGRVQQVFTEITDLLAIGATLEQALDQVGIKVPQASFKFFSVCLLLNQQSGGQLAQVLHQLMANMHQRRSHEKKVLAMTAEPRMSAKIIALLPVIFLLFFYYQMPSAFDFLRYNSTGQWIAGYAFVSTVFGLWLINRMTKVDAL